MSAEETLGKQFHGTDAVLHPGDRILPRSVTGARQNAFTLRDTSQTVSTTAHLPEATRYGQRVYVVRPMGVVGQDPEYGEQGAAHRIHPQARRTYDAREAVVEREVSPEAVSRAQNFRPLPRFEGQPEVRRSVFEDRRTSLDRRQMANRALRKRGLL